MPQANNQREEERIKGNPLSCASSRPTMEEQGLIWCWGESQFRFRRSGENGSDDDAGAGDSRDERGDKKRRSAWWRL